ncbi:MAG TPA: Pls/PosA family non-ribosomal peptide synthetase [Gaiellales bacterium]|nr:Pls/PosA family non-ribosomal peptide synthetase [Gaiellales bacterium]
MTIDLGTPSAADVRAATDRETILAEVLAETAGLGSIPVDGNFFDDLGLDSLMVAHFCARVRNDARLPSISVRDCYQHPTVRDLAAALPEGVSADSAPRRQTEPERTPAGTPEYILCGTLQLLAFLAYATVAGLVFGAGYDWITSGSGWIDLYLRSVLIGCSSFAGMCVLPILAKWTLIGRWKREEIPIWSLRYVRFWLVKTLVQLNPMVLFTGSPLYPLYLRALGAKIGPGVVILSRNAPVCTDLLTIGAGAVIRRDAFFACYRAEAGVIRTGSVSIGRDAFVGQATVLDIDSSLGDRAQLAHASALYEGQAVPDGERRQGTPADERTDVDLKAAIERPGGGARRRGTYGALQLAGLLVLYLPAALAGTYLLSTDVPPFDALFRAAPADIVTWWFLRDALIAGLVLLLGGIGAGLLVVGTVPRLLNLAIRPDRAYPLYGVHYAAHRAIGRLTNVPFFLQLFGDSSYIVHYLRWVGYDLSPVEQTGSNFGTAVGHENPYLTSIGTGTMVADGLWIMNADYSTTAFRLSRATIGRRNFIGNNIPYPSQARTGENALLATKVMVPVDGEVRENVGLLGSPSFPIPRTVERDRRFDHLREGREFRQRLAAKNRHNTVTLGLFLLTRWIYLFGITVIASAAVVLYGDLGAAATAAAFVLLLPFTIAYTAAVERAGAKFRALRPRYCSIYQPDFWRHERYWKLSSHLPRSLDGTPFKRLAWRAFGVRVGRRLFDDGCTMVDKSLVTIGDDCALNAGCVVQPHSQEDGTFKSDRITIGSGCTVGVSAQVHYGVTIGDGASLGPHSFLMKGEEVPPNAHWGMNPATAPRTPIPGRGQAEVDRNPEPADGFGRIPRWTLEPAAGVDEHRSAVPHEVTAAARRLADEIAVPLSTVVHAAHARVLGMLTGEREVMTGYVTEPGDRPLPCRIDAGAESWHALVRTARRAESALSDPARGDDPDGLDGHAEGAFETVLDPTGDRGDPPPGAALRIGISEQAGELTLRLAYRKDVFDPGSAARIAAYHVTALRLLAADPEAEPGRLSLLSEDELRLQLEGFAGPRRELPKRRFHELFEERAATHPDAVAAACGDRRWTYGELNARANRLGGSLLAHGLRPEGVVAVASERNLDWMAAVLAIFKAGGCYLPIEPHLPADRIAAMLSRAACELVLTGPASSTTLEHALESLPGVRALGIDDALDEDRGDRDLGVSVAPEQLAYIYFTSGSTGEPKGAMCEHAGMLNHLYAKLEDLEVREGDVVAQIAPQSFDISLWQLVSALLVGGRTLIVEQELILDIEGFVERIAAGRVNVLQVVPSYLEALLSYLEEYPRELPELRCISVTGEPVKRELLRRWFAFAPAIKVMNAYGLTETSDDTNHEVMAGVPDSDRVPLGRPVRNVRVYVVDERLWPVPLGAPGEIVFSGVCVGRGYVNDPERTRLAFVADPHRQGERLYRSGDYGRWRPDGKLEFLGRRDHQVKIRGHRIEIGEIESALLRVNGVRAAAAVVAEGVAGGKRLVGFYVGSPHPAEALRAALSESLPSYMIPSAFHRRDDLPLTANGKVDSKALVTLAEQVEVR